jgi:hypothetical protein
VVGFARLSHPNYKPTTGGKCIGTRRFIIWMTKPRKTYHPPSHHGVNVLGPGEKWNRTINVLDK